MKIHTLLITGLLVVSNIGCTSKNNLKDPGKWSEKQVSEWFNQKEWLGETELQFNSSFDKKEFAVKYLKNKEWWDKALNFLKHEDLNSLPAGVHELDSQNVFVKITEYNTKNREDVQFEAHKDYSDIQYVVSGAEYIEEANLSNAVLKVPYDSGKDIEFYAAEASESNIAKPGTFYIILPNVLHRSGIKVEESIPVRKIVIKVRN